MVSLGQHSPRKALCSILLANRPVRSWGIFFSDALTYAEAHVTSQETSHGLDCLCNPNPSRVSGKASLRDVVNEMKSARCASMNVFTWGAWQHLCSVLPVLLRERQLDVC